MPDPVPAAFQGCVPVFTGVPLRAHRRRVGVALAPLSWSARPYSGCWPRFHLLSLSSSVEGGRPPASPRAPPRPSGAQGGALGGALGGAQGGAQGGALSARRPPLRPCGFSAGARPAVSVSAPSPAVLARLSGCV